MKGFQSTLPFVRGSHTSRMAAIAMLPKEGTLKRRVLDYLLDHERGATDDEGMHALHMDGSTYRPRRIDLVNDGMVVDSGQRRPTRSGQQAVVWVAT